MHFFSHQKNIIRQQIKNLLQKINIDKGNVISYITQ